MREGPGRPYGRVVPRNPQGMTPNRNRHLFELWLRLGSFVVLVALVALFFWVDCSLEAAAFNRLTTGPKVTVWDAMWLDLRVEAR